MIIKPSMHFSDLIEKIKARSCPDLTNDQVLSGVLHIIMDSTSLSIMDLMNWSDDLLGQEIRKYLWVQDSQAKGSRV